MPRINKDEIVPSGIVYKLHHKYLDLGNNFYIGSTVSEKDRRCTHKTACNNQNNKDYNYHVYKYIRENGGWNSWELEPIKKFENITIRELERHEQQTRDELKPNLNMRLSGLECSHLYQIDQKEYKKEYNKQYFQEHQDEILEKNKQYRREHRNEILEKQKQKFTCECGGKYTYTHKALHLKTKKHQKWIASQ